MARPGYLLIGAHPAISTQVFSWELVLKAVFALGRRATPNRTWIKREQELAAAWLTPDSKSIPRDRILFLPICLHLKPHQLLAHPPPARLLQRTPQRTRASWPPSMVSTLRINWLLRVIWPINSRRIAVILPSWIATQNIIQEGQWELQEDLSRDSTSPISVTRRTTGERLPKPLQAVL